MATNAILYCGLTLQPTGVRPQLIFLFSVSEFLMATFSYNQTKR